MHMHTSRVVCIQKTKICNTYPYMMCMHTLASINIMHKYYELIILASTLNNNSKLTYNMHTLD